MTVVAERPDAYSGVEACEPVRELRAGEGPESSLPSLAGEHLLDVSSGEPVEPDEVGVVLGDESEDALSVQLPVDAERVVDAVEDADDEPAVGGLPESEHSSGAAVGSEVERDPSARVELGWLLERELGPPCGVDDGEVSGVRPYAEVFPRERLDR